MKSIISILSILVILSFLGGLLYSIIKENPSQKRNNIKIKYAEPQLDSLCSMHLPSEFENRKTKVIYLNSLIDEEN